MNTVIRREELTSYAQSFGLAIGVHLLMVLLIVIGTFNWKPFRQQQPVGLTIEAVIVDTSEIRERREEAQRAAEQAEQRKEQQERRARELAQQQQREKEAEVQRQQAIEQQKKREAEAEARRKKEAQDRLQALRMENERKLQEERQKQQRELEQIREQAAAAEKQRKLEEERLKQIEAREKAAQAEKQRQQQAAEQKKQQEAEQRAAQAGRTATLEDKYKGLIQQIVTQNWLRPPTARAGLRCTLKIVQIPGGEVISAAIAGSCNGDEATRRSVVAAVERAGSLPYRGYEDVFEREIEFIFIYDGD